MFKRNIIDNGILNYKYIDEAKQTMSMFNEKGFYQPLSISIDEYGFYHTLDKTVEPYS
jgi:hypothetical protein